jgi:hypothetical protein
MVILILQEHNGTACLAESEITTAGYVATALKFSTFVST